MRASILNNRVDAQDVSNPIMEQKAHKHAIAATKYDILVSNGILWYLELYGIHKGF